MNPPEWIQSDRATAGRTWLGGLGVLTIAGSLVWAAGPVGLAGGAFVAAVWFFGPGPTTVAAGHVALLPLVSDDAALPMLVVLEAGFVAVLAAPAVQEADWITTVAATVLLATVLGAAAWLGWQAWQPRWLVGLVLVAAVAVGLYAVHRYSVVALEFQGAEPRP